MNISQEARDAAADLVNAAEDHVTAARIRAGIVDSHDFAQAFQRAIDAAHARGVAEIRNSSVIEFLLGEGPLDGCHFGEKPDHECGQFWWRKHLLAAIREQDQ
jgi:hypothetical protein